MSEVLPPSSIDPEDMLMLRRTADYERITFKDGTSYTRSGDEISFFPGETSLGDGTLRISVNLEDPTKVSAYNRKSKSERWTLATADNALLVSKATTLCREAAAFIRKRWKDNYARIAARTSKTNDDVTDLLKGL